MCIDSLVQLQFFSQQYTTVIHNSFQKDMNVYTCLLIQHSDINLLILKKKTVKMSGTKSD